MPSNLKNVDECDMVNSRIEALAKKAFRAAYKEALASEGGSHGSCGWSVVSSV